MKHTIVTALILLFLQPAFAESARLGEIRTTQYREMQAKLCRGWNTWYNNSMSSHTFLPDGFTVNFGFALHNGKDYARQDRGEI